MIKELPLVDFDTAKLLKEKGFDFECVDAFMINNESVEPISGGTQNWNIHNDILISRPTVSLAIRWMRETHGLLIAVWVDPVFEGYQFRCMRLSDKEITNILTTPYPTYDLAESAALSHALKLLK